MMPTYRCRDSHPYQGNQMAFPHYYQPGMELISPQMNVDPPKSPFTYEQPWPYAGSHGYPTPIEVCCGHHKFPGYCSYRPTYPHMPSSSPMYFSGGCPAYADHFYVPYATPPQYNMELPRYEYDKCMPREYHCCGCPNYPSNHKEGKIVKIEEHEPDGEKKGNNAVAPVQMKSYPYPFVWTPPMYRGNGELKKPVAAEMCDQDRISHDEKPVEYARADEEEPKVRNGWFPLDINSLSNMIQDGSGRRNKNWQIDNTKREFEDERTNQSQHRENNEREFPFPIIWMPHYNMQDVGRTNNQESTSTPKSIQDVSHAFKSPVSYCSGDDVLDRINVNGNDLKTVGSDVTREVKNEGGSPVKQMELHQEKNDPEGSDKRVRNIPVKQIEGDMTDKESQTSVKRLSSSTDGNMNDKESPTGVKRRSISPRKTSKLPPVCLRVDPLPRRRNGNGSSRSPSPPASKKHSQATAVGTSKAFASSSMHENAQADVKLQNASNVSDQVKPKEISIKVVEKSSENKDKGESDGSQNHDKAQAELKFQNASNVRKEVKPKERSIKVLEKSSEKRDEDQRDGSWSQITSNLTNGVHENSSASSLADVEENRAKEKAESKVDSANEEEAARVSTKQTNDESGKERQLMSDVEAAVLIQAAYRGFQMRKWEPLKKLKQIAEVSMHVADVRGSIQALETSSDFQNDEKQRVIIGEAIMRLLLKLDTVQGLHPSFRETRKSLARELTSLQEKLDSIMAKKSQQQVEELSARKPVQPEKKVAEHGKEVSSEGTICQSRDMLDTCQDRLSMKEGNSSYEDEKLQSVVQIFPVDDDKCESSSPVDHVVNEEIEPLPNGMVNEGVSLVSMDAFSGSGISESETAAQNETNSESVEADDLDMEAWKELPRGVLDEEEIADDLRKDKQNEIASEEPQLPFVTTLPVDMHFPAMTNDSAEDGASSEIREVAKLPVGLLDDDTASEILNHDATEISKKVLKGREGEYKGTVKTTSSEDDIPIEIQLDERQLEEQEEMQSTEESDGRVKLELQKDEINRGALLDEEVEKRSGEENEKQSLTTEFTGKDGRDVADEDACLEVKDVPVAESPEEEVKKGGELKVEEIPVAEMPEEEAKKGEELEVKEVPTAKTGEEVTKGEAPKVEGVVKEAQSEGGDIVSEQVIDADADIGNREVLAEQKGEQSVGSSVSKEASISEHDGEKDDDKNFIEDNEKLRQMIQKLLEAGNEQLTVISNLTGRVRDLEKKLARKKRVRTKHCRPATSKPSCKKSSNNPLQGGVGGVM